MNINKKNKSSINLGLIIGTIGFIAGIGLLFTESWLIGIFGSIASFGIAYKGYQDSKEPKD
ncbi:hypothetical protein EQY75_08375 [Muriicola soli]|uniref:Uncharacterized protein n=1 Tax=Muriicola soli TaxID=2507538 RepID=A0A411EA35_9FLAO|nr:hypothetical protein EQY75_08375 [Muriicola soli]